MNVSNKTAVLIFPHQLFELSPLLKTNGMFFLIEEPLFFSQYKFHVQKLILHRSSMKFYYEFLKEKNIDITYIENKNSLSDVRNLIKYLKKEKFDNITYINCVDNYLDSRIQDVSKENNIKIKILESPMFLNSKSEIDVFFGNNKSKFLHSSFYTEQRKKHRILIDQNGKPEGGKWTFDADNRKKYPKNKIPPKIKEIQSNKYFDEAVNYIQLNFKDNPGNIPKKPQYPISFKLAKEWLQDFLENRFFDFGIYEDAILEKETFLNHSIISPLLNIGLLTPDFVVNESLKFSKHVPINSLEGFIRQIIGWREFIRGVYIYKGSFERKNNFFGFKRKIPKSFYNATTGILPVDNAIKKTLDKSYCHHIERLMILGNFMLLCEFDPDEVYRWFMELFIDSYDWVMVPNVYGMSQFSDGGIMSTKPYISSSNYIKKMSDFNTKGEWTNIWDGLYWRFIDNHREVFNKNIRMKFMINMYDKMKDEKKNALAKSANAFLNSIS